MKTFEQFILEYQKYSDYQKGWGTPEDIKNDVILSVKHLIPKDFKSSEEEIVSVEDQSDEQKGIKFEIKLKSGDLIHAYKTNKFKSGWEWYLNKKKLSNSEIKNQLEEKMYKPFDRWKRQYDMRDKTYMYSDDHRSFIGGVNHDKLVQSLYDKLSSSDKKKADEYIRHMKNIPSFEEFIFEAISPSLEDLLKTFNSSPTLYKIEAGSGTYSNNKPNKEWMEESFKDLIYINFFNDEYYDDLSGSQKEIYQKKVKDFINYSITNFKKFYKEWLEDDRGLIKLKNNLYDKAQNLIKV